MIGIYKITNKINGKVYIGQSLNISSRKGNHKVLLKNNQHPNDLLQNDWNKYGENNFEFDILEECEPYKLDIREQFYINTIPVDLRYNLVNAPIDKTIYKYTIKDLQNKFGKSRTTIIYKINQLKLDDVDKYYRNVKENGREKVYYTQELLDLLGNQTSYHTNKSKQVLYSNEIIAFYQGQIDLLKEQLKNKDAQIEQLQRIILSITK